MKSCLRDAHTSYTPCRRNVSFNPKAKGKLCIHINNYTQKEIRACWYSPREYNQFKREAQCAVALINKGIKIDETRSSVRGLESKTKSGRKVATTSRENALNAVFTTQTRPRQQRTSLQEQIASQYQEAAEESRMKAYTIGLSNQTEIYPGATATKKAQQMATGSVQGFVRIRLSWQFHNERPLFCSAA